MGKTKSRDNGEGTIFKRKIRGKDVWVMEYTLGKKSNGKLKRKTVYGKTREEVKEKYKQLLIELGTNSYVDRCNATFEEIAKSIIEKGYRLNHLSDAGFLRKEASLKQIQGHYIAKKSLQDINSKDVEDFLEYITKYADESISKIYGLSRAVFRKGLKDKIVTYNFFDDKDEFPVPKSKKAPKIVRGFTILEQKAFIEVLSNSNKILYKTQFLLELYTGMRMGEILALTLDDINFNDNTITIYRTLTKSLDYKTKMGKKTKTYSGSRIIHVEQFIMNILSNHIKHNYVLNDKKLLFYDVKKTYFTVSQINSAFKRICQKYNISKGWDVNQHMLRHTFATRCIESGVPATVLAKILGHKTIKTTLETYCDVFAEYERLHSANAISYLKEQNLIINS